MTYGIIKKISGIVLLLLLPFISDATHIECKDLHQGIYKLRGLYGSLHSIVRANNTQTETVGRTGAVFEYDVLWTSDCTFLLLHPRVIQGDDSMLTISPGDTIYNEIVEVNPYWHKVISSVNNCDPKTEASYFNVDTTKYYRDLNDLEILKQYNGPLSGGTFVGYNYAVTYKQHSADPKNYVIAFLEALTVNDKSRFKLLDDIHCTIDTTQKITTCNCRYNNQYDKEIIAIYTSTDSSEEATIIKAWRFNKLKLKIEEVESARVKFKEADKKLPLWEN